MVLYSFGFAAFLFTSLPANEAGPLLRRAFPQFYLFVLGVSTVSAPFLLPSDPTGAALMGLVAITVIPARQVLLPAINEATDSGQKRRFRRLHRLSVAVTLAHIAMAAAVLSRFT